MSDNVFQDNFWYALGKRHCDLGKLGSKLYHESNSRHNDRILYKILTYDMVMVAGMLDSIIQSQYPMAIVCIRHEGSPIAITNVFYNLAERQEDATITTLSSFVEDVLQFIHDVSTLSVIKNSRFYEKRRFSEYSKRVIKLQIK